MPQAFRHNVGERKNVHLVFAKGQGSVPLTRDTSRSADTYHTKFLINRYILNSSIRIVRTMNCATGLDKVHYQRNYFIGCKAVEIFRWTESPTEESVLELQL